MSEIDITRLLRSWPYEPGRIIAKRITGDDGRPKLQVRLDLGVLQMEMQGRPDGSEPEGFESLLVNPLRVAQELALGRKNRNYVSNVYGRLVSGTFLRHARRVCQQWPRRSDRDPEKSQRPCRSMTHRIRPTGNRLGSRL